MKAKKVLLIVIVLLFIASVPVAVFLINQRKEIRLRAAPASTLSFVPSTLTVYNGQSFTLEAVVETDTNVVPAAELHITFDPAVFEASNLVSGNDLPDTFDGPIIDNQAGTAFIVVGDIENPVEGSGTVASIDFVVIDESDSVEEIAFANQTQAGAWYEEGVNVLIDTNPARITIAGAGGGESTPTPTTAPTATPTIGAGTAATPTPTPTIAPTKSPEASPTPPVTGLDLPTWVFLGFGLLLLLIGTFVFV